MRNIRLAIQYDGTRYKGWQRQKNRDDTIQSKLEIVLSRITGEPINVIGAGRTDAGVHAQNQAANFHTSSTLSLQRILDDCHRYLPEDIVIKSAEEADPRFHARYQARFKKYIYSIDNGRYHDVFLRRHAYHIGTPLDMKKMADACIFLRGRHDFRSFTSFISKKKSTIVELKDLHLTRENELLSIHFEAQSFLSHMIRIITGTLIEIGMGNLDRENLKEILEKRERKAAAFTAPARGLCLISVEY